MPNHIIMYQTPNLTPVLPKNTKMENPQQPPIIVTSLPLPLDHTLTSLLEVALQGQGLALNFILENQPVTLIIQNAAHLAKVMVEALNRALAAFAPKF